MKQIFKSKGFSSKGQSQYAWIFSIIIGAVIIFLAIYFAGNYISTSKYQSNIALARELDIILNPFSSIGSIATMTLSKSITLPSEALISFKCNSNEDYETISIKTKKGEESAEYKIKNKYIFSENLNSKELWIFAKPITLPWRVDDLIYFVDKEYCFVNPPESIKNEISDLKSKNLVLECSTKSKKVCFSSGLCDIKVDYSNGIVTKNKESLRFYDDASMYAAIFSENSLYKCNMQRIFDRLSVQTEINLQKAIDLEIKGCDTKALQTSLIGLKNLVEKNIPNIKYISEEIKNKNPTQCPVF